MMKGRVSRVSVSIRPSRSERTSIRLSTSTEPGRDTSVPVRETA